MRRYQTVTTAAVPAISSLPQKNRQVSETGSAMINPATADSRQYLDHDASRRPIGDHRQLGFFSRAATRSGVRPARLREVARQLLTARHTAALFWRDMPSLAWRRYRSLRVAEVDAGIFRDATAIAATQLNVRHALGSGSPARAALIPGSRERPALIPGSRARAALIPGLRTRSIQGLAGLGVSRLATIAATADLPVTRRSFSPPASIRTAAGIALARAAGAGLRGGAQSGPGYDIRRAFAQVLFGTIKATRAFNAPTTRQPARLNEDESLTPRRTLSTSQQWPQRGVIRGGIPSHALIGSVSLRRNGTKSTLGIFRYTLGVLENPCRDAPDAGYAHRPTRGHARPGGRTGRRRPG